PISWLGLRLHRRRAHHRDRPATGATLRCNGIRMPTASSAAYRRAWRQVGVGSAVTAMTSRPHPDKRLPTSVPSVALQYRSIVTGGRRAIIIAPNNDRARSLSSGTTLPRTAPALRRLCTGTPAREQPRPAAEVRPT